MKHVLAALLVLLPAAPAAAGPAQIVLIRHGEKPPEGNGLDVPGQERAAAYVAYFQIRPEMLQFGKPVAIYAQGAKSAEKSQRPVQTVKPLADALKLPVIDKYTREEFAKMVQEIQNNRAYDGKMVLICWEHHVILNIAKAFGARDLPERWHGHVFDRSWVLTFASDGSVGFRNLPQRLMFGDSKE